MHNTARSHSSIFGVSLSPANALLAIRLTLLLLIFLPLFITLAALPAQAQTYRVIYNFSSGADGSGPYCGLTLDRAGSLYGTTNTGSLSYGSAFKLTNRNGSWLATALHDFTGGDDGAFPVSRVLIAPDGTVYGSTPEGGTTGCMGRGCGTLFHLQPPPRACSNVLCPWAETILYRFSGGSDGGVPYGDLMMDQAGTIYGTASDYNGVLASGYGQAFTLTPSGGGWTYAVLYTFTGGNDGAYPLSGLISDNAGNLYGTSREGGDLTCNSPSGCGTVFQLTPSGSGWTEHPLYSFHDGSDGRFPYAGLIFDRLGNLYGTTSSGGSGGGGTVFELVSSNGSWTYTLLYSLTGPRNCGPEGTLIMDAAGSLYGTTYCDGAFGLGSVFRLTPGSGGWTYSPLHDFAGGSDGQYTVGGVIFDANSNLYGTTVTGGSHNNGTVFEITP